MQSAGDQSSAANLPSPTDIRQRESSTPSSSSIHPPPAANANADDDHANATPHTNPNPTSNPTPNPQRSNSTSTSHLNPRSCVTCRRRKVRCNKEVPCSNCVRAGIECTFPGPGRAPRKTKKPPDAELLARLRKLESVVTNLGAQVDENGVLHTTPTKKEGLQQTVGSLGDQHAATNAPRDAVGEQLGRLVINEDRSRYVSNQFWASMGDEIAEMRDLLDADTSDDALEEYESPSDKFSSHQGFVFGYSSLKVDLKALHPSPSQIFILWEVFKENVDPVVRLLHRPTAKNILINAASSVDKVSKPAEALLFSIYFGAVVSLTADQCRQLLDEDKSELVKKYRFATEQALARAGFLNSSSLMCLQAFVFFLVFVRHMDDSRLVWALSGLAIHLAQALGIHRDGTHFGLTPFDVEMRRRLWWHISILDNRSAEDHGTDPTFSESFYDTKLPLNVNDEDIYPDMQHPPTPRPGSTEMTFCLIRFELSVFSRRLNLTCPGGQPGHARASRTFDEKEQMIDSCHRDIEEKYLQHCEMSVPILWVAATVARLILAKMWLMVHHPKRYKMDHDGQALPAETKDRLFVTSTEVIEFSFLLEKNENTAKWGWLFRTYMQWQSVAFVLSEIIVRPPGPEVERAWTAIESVCKDHFGSSGFSTKSHKGMLWRPMRALLAKAKEVRTKQLRDGKIPVKSAGGADTSSASPMSGASIGGKGIGRKIARGQGQPQFDFQSDPWMQHMTDPDNIMGATVDALGMEFDFASVISPSASDESGGGHAPPQRQNDRKNGSQRIPRAMSSVFGSNADQMQGVAHSPTLSISSDFGTGTGSDHSAVPPTTTADLGIAASNTTSQPGFAGPTSSTSDRIPGTYAGNAMGVDGGFNFNPNQDADFLNWSWSPGVGDFAFNSTGPTLPPDPMSVFWDNGLDMGMGMPSAGMGDVGASARGGSLGGGGDGPAGSREERQRGQQQFQHQQQWY